MCNAFMKLTDDKVAPSYCVLLLISISQQNNKIYCKSEIYKGHIQLII